MDKPKTTPTSKEEQYSALAERQERANYTDPSLGEVESFSVSDPSAIWLQNASGFAFQLLDAVPVSVFVKDANSRYTYLNAKARQMMDFENRLVLGRKDADVLIDEHNLQTYIKEDALVMKDGRKRSITEPWETQTGEYVVHETTRFAIHNAHDRRIIGVVSVAEDLSFKQKAQVGQEILHMIAHDWITEILKSLSVQINDSSDRNLKYRVSLIDFVIEYIQNLSFYYAGETEPRKFSRGLTQCKIMDDILTPMVEFFRYFAQGDKYYPVPTIESHLTKTDARCNRGLIKLLIYQQVRNHGNRPLQSTADGKIPLQIIAETTATGFALTFLSAGPPIPEDIRRKLGQIFSRTARPEEEEDEHLCLGMYFCDKIARLHGGIPPVYDYDEGLKANRFRYTFDDVAPTEIIDGKHIPD